MPPIDCTVHFHKNRFAELLKHSILLALSGGVAAAYADEATVLPTISVQAAEQKAFSGNMDLVRSENDTQAYQIITREKIENSGATTVDELLQKVSTATTSVGAETAGGWTGNTSQINLRGLGASHTLVLINGRKGAGVGGRGVSEMTDQQNLNSIPLSAIERIEILPSSASALYGSNALGGVINVILRRDYVGTEVNVRYDNSVNSDTALKTVNLTSGFALEDGRTQVLFTAQKQEGNGLKAKDRPFKLKERQRILENNPDQYYGTTVSKGQTQSVNPPMGHLTNIRTVDGSALIGNSGPSYAYVPKGYQTSDGVQPFNETVGQYALGLANGIGGDSGAQNLVGAKDNEAFSVSINRDFSDKLNIYAEGGYEEQFVESAGNYHGFGTVTLSKDNPNNPFGKDILVTYSPDYADGLALRNREMYAKSRRLAGGFEFKPTEDWQILGDYSWTNTFKTITYQRRPTVGTTKFNEDLASGALNPLNDVTTHGIDLNRGYWGVAQNLTDQTTREFNVRAHGPVYNWYAGDIMLAAGVGHSDWESRSRSETTSLNNPDAPFTHKETTTQAVYAELNIPFISPKQEFAWAKLLDLQLAARYENFNIKTNGASFSQTSPTVGLRFAPNDSWMLRTSYSEGFIVPTAAQLDEPVLSSSLTSVTDPLTGATQDIYTTGGGDPSLEPETAKTFGVGLVFTPESVPNLRMSVDYFNIQKNNNITSLGAQRILDLNAQQDLYGDRVVRNADGSLNTVIVTPFNALWMETSGIDTQISYAIDTLMGDLNLNAGYTWTEKFLQKESLDSPATSYLNDPNSDSNGPLKHRFNASAFLQATDAWGFGWGMQYYGKYDLKNETAIKLQGKDTVDAQMYHDVFARYRMNGGKAAKFGSPEFTFGIKNLFSDYEEDMSQTYISKYSDPRLRQYYLNLKVNF